MIRPEEAVAVNLTWKVPAVLFYQSTEVPAAIREIQFVNPITADVFNEDKSLTSRRIKRTTFAPLGGDEMPKAGDLVAIDAEFVTLNQEESELRSDGKVKQFQCKRSCQSIFRHVFTYMWLHGPLMSPWLNCSRL